MSVALLFRTDGRDELLANTIQSAFLQLRGYVSEHYIYTDNGLDHVKFLHGVYPGFVVFGDERRGFGGALNNAWMSIAQVTKCTWLFDSEDDFLYNRPVVIPKMIDVMEQYDYLVQMALRRQPWNEAEKKAGGIVEMWPDEYVDQEWMGQSWLEHRLFCTSNPALWRMDTVADGWPIVEHSERIFSDRVFEDPDAHSAFWGKRSDPPWVTHVGMTRAGTTY